MKITQETLEQSRQHLSIKLSNLERAKIEYWSQMGVVATIESILKGEEDGEFDSVPAES